MGHYAANKCKQKEQSFAMEKISQIKTLVLLSTQKRKRIYRYDEGSKT